MTVEDKWKDMNSVAAAGSIEFVNIPEDRAEDAAEAIIDNAPEHLQEDFKLSCAYHIYRALLMEAVINADVGQIYNAQNSLMRLMQI